VVSNTDAHDRAIQHARLNPKLVVDMLAMLQEREPHLYELDREMLVIRGMAKIAERRILPDGPVQQRHMARCTLLALDAMVQAAGTSSAEGLGAMRYLGRMFAAWHTGVIGLARKFNARVTLSPHEDAILHVWWAQRRVLGIPREFDQFTLVAITENRKLGLPDDRQAVNQDLSVFRALTDGTPGGVFVGKDRRMRLGWRQYRDEIASFSELPRTGDADLVAKSTSLDEPAGQQHDVTLHDVTAAPRTEEPSPDQVSALKAALGSLPIDLVDQIAAIHEALDARQVLDALTEASQASDPAKKAAILRRGTNGQLTREQLAEAFDTTISKIRTAEEKI